MLLAGFRACHHRSVRGGRDRVGNEASRNTWEDVAHIAVRIYRMPVGGVCIVYTLQCLEHLEGMLHQVGAKLVQAEVPFLFYTFISLSCARALSLRHYLHYNAC